MEDLLEGLYRPTDADRERYRGMSIAILMPCNDYKTWIRQMACSMKLMAYSWFYGLPIYQFAFTERMVVDWARGQLARSFLGYTCEYTGQPFTHALWIDDDQVFNPDMACRLAAVGHLDMVSAVYYGRTKPYLPTVYLKDNSDNPYKHWPMTECPPAVFEVDAVGFGALLMRRDVLEGTPEPWFTIDPERGEDIGFCKRAKEYGFRIWACGDYKIGHLTGRPAMITEKDFDAHRATHPEEFGNRVRVSLEALS